MNMTMSTSRGSWKQAHHIHRIVSWAREVPPYGVAVPNSLIQYSSRFLRWRVLILGLLVEWYIFSKKRTFKDNTEWLGWLKCWYRLWLPAWLISDRWPFIRLLSRPLVSSTYNVQSTERALQSIDNIRRFTIEIIKISCGIDFG